MSAGNKVNVVLTNYEVVKGVSETLEKRHMFQPKLRKFSDDIYIYIYLYITFLCRRCQVLRSDHGKPRSVSWKFSMVLLEAQVF